MSITPENESAPPDQSEPAAGDIGSSDIDSQANAMKDQLRKDVASWRVARSDGAEQQATDFRVAVAKPAARTRRAKPAAPPVKPQQEGKRPFSMSYDGVTEADYITYMIARGAR